MFSIPSHRRLRANLTRARSRRIITVHSGLSELLLKQPDPVLTVAISVLLAWTLSNALLAAIIISTIDGESPANAVNGYMAFLLYSVAGLACE